MPGLPASHLVFSTQQIESALDTMAAALSQDMGEEHWVLLTVMHGGVMVTSELMKRLTCPMTLDMVRLTRYHDSTSGGELHWRYMPQTLLSGANVLLVDDIFDEGATLAELVRYCREQGASRVLTAVLLDKHHERKTTDIRPDHVGLTCDDVYVFGFGMDMEGLWRNLPEIRGLGEKN